LDNGEHRIIRQNANQEPLNSPCLWRASNA